MPAFYHAGAWLASGAYPAEFSFAVYQQLAQKPRCVVYFPLASPRRTVRRSLITEAVGNVPQTLRLPSRPAASVPTIRGLHMATEFYFEDLYLRDGAGNRYCGPLEGWCRCDAGSVTGIDLPAWTALDTSFAKAERKTLASDEWLAIHIAAALKQTNVYAAKIIADMAGGDDGEFDEDRYLATPPERLHYDQRDFI